jgi:hypothetical protein
MLFQIIKEDSIIRVNKYSYLFSYKSGKVKQVKRLFKMTKEPSIYQLLDSIKNIQHIPQKESFDLHSVYLLVQNFRLPENAYNSFSCKNPFLGNSPDEKNLTSLIEWLYAIDSPAPRRKPE